jgi:hypothetical protein
MRPVRKWRSAVLGGVETERFLNNAKLARSVPAMGRDDFTLSEYPFDWIELACEACERRGRDTWQCW